MKQIMSERGISCSTLREIVLLNQLRQNGLSNIVEIKDVEVRDAESGPSLTARKRSMGLVFDCSDTDLHKYIKDFNNKLSIEKIQSFIFQILQGLYNIHSFKIIHRDLKPQNILIKNGTLKIADFGLACSVSPFRERLTPDMVSLCYRCPELLLGETSYSYGVDIWSVGCILAEMITRTSLFKGRTVIDQLEHIFKILGTPNDTTWPKLTELSKDINIQQYHGKDLKSLFNLDDISAHFLQETLQCNPQSRPNAKILLYHKFVKTNPQKQKVYDIISNQNQNQEIPSHTNENIDLLQQVECKLYDGTKLKVSHSNNMYKHSTYRNDITVNFNHLNSSQICQNIPVKKSMYDSKPKEYISVIVVSKDITSSVIASTLSTGPSNMRTTNPKIIPSYQPSEEDILNVVPLLKPIKLTPENKLLLHANNDDEYHPFFSECAMMDVVDSTDTLDTPVDSKTCGNNLGFKRSMSASNFENLPTTCTKIMKFR